MCSDLDCFNGRNRIIYRKDFYIADAFFILSTYPIKVCGALQVWEEDDMSEKTDEGADWTVCRVGRVGRTDAGTEIYADRAYK